MITNILSVTVDLNRGITRTPMGILFAQNDSEAQTIRIAMTRGGIKEDLTGATVTGYFIRAYDNATVVLSGTASGNVAEITLSGNCYLYPGAFSLAVRVTKDGKLYTAFYGTGAVTRTATDTIVDPTNVIPSLEALLAQIDTMEADTAAAEAATTAANTAASRAETAAALVDGLTVSANTVRGDSGAAATLTETDGHYNIAFDIPAGVLPTITFTVATGDPSEDVTITSVTGTAEAPVINLRIPRGKTGAIENLTINGVAVTSGSITLTAEDIGARPDTWTPTAEEVGALPDSTSIPSKTSDLTNDSGFITGVGMTAYPLAQGSSVTVQPGFFCLRVDLGATATSFTLNCSGIGDQAFLFAMPFQAQCDNTWCNTRAKSSTQVIVYAGAATQNFTGYGYASGTATFSIPS